MPDNQENNDTVSYEELLINNTIEQEALVNLLVKKGLITHAELLEEIKRISQA